MFNCHPKLALHPTSNEQDCCVPYIHLQWILCFGFWPFQWVHSSISLFGLIFKLRIIQIQRVILIIKCNNTMHKHIIQYPASSEMINTHYLLCFLHMVKLTWIPSPGLLLLILYTLGAPGEHCCSPYRHSNYVYIHIHSWRWWWLFHLYSIPNSPETI